MKGKTGDKRHTSDTPAAATVNPRSRLLALVSTGIGIYRHRYPPAVSIQMMDTHVAIPAQPISLSAILISHHRAFGRACW
ncbi:hypothetical protein [Dickeya zeae]|uniref:hypothetical protein n=1 Tax=Dickeya zeae TaxID=204042 RepID=UPI00039CFDA4|nr:hypothetical protein [Dickeya zeae]